MEEVDGRMNRWPPIPLKYGSLGPEVMFLQSALVLHGYSCRVNGIFAEETQEKVKEFQMDHGLNPDGMILSHTFWQELLDL